MQRRIVLTALVAGLLAAGCAGIDSVAVNVSSQGSWPADRKPGSYVIERLPSQQANLPEQERIEAAAQQAIEAAGFNRAGSPQDADVLIQVGARTFEVLRPSAYYASPFYWRNDWWYHGGRWPRFYGPYGPYGPAFGAGYYASDLPDYQREIAILMRDRRSQQIVYETRAVYTSRWSSDALLPAMFEAAMKDFPLQAISPRVVTVALPKT
jgi:hypothetical protein